MLKQPVSKIKKLLTILLASLFVLLLTTATENLSLFTKCAAAGLATYYSSNVTIAPSIMNSFRYLHKS
jgi:negative regulator of sigma E activity